ncbi:hypothetical protein GCM10027414_36880 [Humibacter ginsengiterrae]
MTAAGLLAFGGLIFAAGLVLMIGVFVAAEWTDRAPAVGLMWAGIMLIVASIVPMFLAGLLGSAAKLFGGGKPPEATSIFVGAIVLIGLGLVGIVAWFVAQRRYNDSALWGLITTVQSNAWGWTSLVLAIGGMWLLMDGWAYTGIMHAASNSPALP